VSRWIVTGIFVVLSGATGATIVTTWGDAVVEPSAQHLAVAGYWTMKLAVVLAFTFFVFTRSPSRRPSRDPVAFAACAMAVGVVLVLEGPSESASAGLVLAGDLVTLVSCAWLLVAVLALGRCFGVLPEARGLVTTGPYRLVRHPVYLGELGACAGLVIAAPSTVNLVAALAFAGAQAVRMGLEEAALTAEFPEYEAYAAQTPRLVPRLLSDRPGAPDDPSGSEVATAASHTWTVS
jgi:protein-S-isoprenylcysteine O-methyltransferase Ste14